MSFEAPKATSSAGADPIIEESLAILRNAVAEIEGKAGKAFIGDKSHKETMRQRRVQLGKEIKRMGDADPRAKEAAEARDRFLSFWNKMSKHLDPGLGDTRDEIEAALRKLGAAFYLHSKVSQWSHNAAGSDPTTSSEAQTLHPSADVEPSNLAHLHDLIQGVAKVCGGWNDLSWNLEEKWSRQNLKKAKDRLTNSLKEVHDGYNKSQDVRASLRSVKTKLRTLNRSLREDESILSKTDRESTAEEINTAVERLRDDAERRWPEKGEKRGKRTRRGKGVEERPRQKPRLDEPEASPSIYAPDEEVVISVVSAKGPSPQSMF
jgi:hypothetical protein